MLYMTNRSRTSIEMAAWCNESSVQRGGEKAAGSRLQALFELVDGAELLLHGGLRRIGGLPRQRHRVHVQPQRPRARLERPTILAAVPQNRL